MIIEVISLEFKVCSKIEVFVLVATVTDLFESDLDYPQLRLPLRSPQPPTEPFSFDHYVGPKYFSGF